MTTRFRRATALLGLLLLSACADAGAAHAPEAGLGSSSAALLHVCSATRSLTVDLADHTGTKVVTTIAHFSNPVDPCLKMERGAPGYMAGDANIATELIRLINATPDGGTIRGNIFNLNLGPVGEALLTAAQTKNVYLSFDETATHGSNAAQIDLLKRLTSPPIHASVCPAKSGCITTAANGIAHTKLFTFSRTTLPEGDATPVPAVWFSSANLTAGADGTKAFNNAVTVYNDYSLYKDLDGYAQRLFNQVHAANNDFYVPSGSQSTGYWADTSAIVYATPENTNIDGVTPATPVKDMVVERLNDYEPSSGCEVYVAHAHFNTRDRVVEQLVKMKAGGCDVRVVGMRSHYTDATVTPLTAAGIPVQYAATHNKFIAVHAKDAATHAFEWRVLTGSHNLTLSTETKIDDILVKLRAETELSGHPIFDAFETSFLESWAASTPACPNGGTEAFSGGIVGCPGTETFDAADPAYSPLCPDGFHRCSLRAWIANFKATTKPKHSYWTSMFTVGFGATANCTVYGVPDPVASPFHICAGATDPEGNQCSSYNCAYEAPGSGNRYLGSGNAGVATAGSLCCP